MVSEKKSPFFRSLTIALGVFLIGLLTRGNPTVLSIDQGPSLRHERKEFFWWGQKIREEIDSNGDGRNDIWRIFRNGKPFELKSDANLDGRVDLWARVGEDGELTTMRGDTDFDRIIDFSGDYFLRKKK